jgi:tRNA1(Val) A37 N6-methylase TrmN6
VDLTDGTLLGGRMVYRQPRDGYRTGLEPVLLAASVPARPGERVVEAGTGAGAGLLCLLSRVAGLTGIGLERDGAMAQLARDNLDANGFAGAAVLQTEIAAWQPDAAFDHAFANPPWHDQAGTASPMAAREGAKRAAPGLIAAWAAALAKSLRPRGTLSFILPAAALAEASLALEAAKCPEITLVPLWPREGAGAKMMIIRGVRLGRGPCAVHPGLILHAGHQTFTAAAQAVLESGADLT